ncbi:DUF1310 family protein [Gemella cuniculi]|uniref:DUF1310 family protein n=1 Tax=Gemella cuniculi TaxID=150240 RepID=UPI0003F67385|nr:DUF1310 family protein [Gemella cuniculi]
MLKKIIIGILGSAIVVGLLIGGKIYMDNRQVETIVKSEEGKAAIEKMLKVLDEKALTSEGKIKSYKIDDSYTKKNPMGGINIRIIVNEDVKKVINTTLEKYPSSKGYEINSKAISPELAQEIKGTNK